MKVCRQCQKVWGENLSFFADQIYLLTHIKTLQLDWCGTCRKVLMDEFEAQFAKPRLRLEAKK